MVKRQDMKINSAKIYVIVITLLLFGVSSCNQNRTISIKAALVYKTGAQPVAREKFYLLTAAAQTVLENQDAGFFFSPSSVKFINSVDNSLNNKRISTLKVGIIEYKIKDYLVTTATTDFEGNAKFENVPKGIYYIVGLATTRSESGCAVWKVKVDTENIKETILLDQNNAFKVEN